MPCDHRLLDLLDEQALAAGLGEHPVVGRADCHNLDRSVSRRVRGEPEPKIADEGGLVQRRGLPRVAMRRWRGGLALSLLPVLPAPANAPVSRDFASALCAREFKEFEGKRLAGRGLRDLPRFTKVNEA